jgi:hypothetical protein
MLKGMVNEEISKAGHVKKHDERPFPGMCFPFYNC